MLILCSRCWGGGQGSRPDRLAGWAGWLAGADRGIPLRFRLVWFRGRFAPFWESILAARGLPFRSRLGFRSPARHPQFH
ncbi:hypothetical protein FIBSPDRAFT_135999 [Athelia psychrophila]|uniref:Uncharacterized protein n=1 Tax=Athelia psychrophila TaxID=1759441 RepID=A0A166C3G2_9AGAM|nr:hypothetical protein FIBSPDRAFT_135995 [Fibularhizoctonia sp. CBS 109695]KZP13252.1 hypothetical protein FIBSPDRAFT_135999 [Fibularhizoctonia sp. CBS 109695]